MNSTPPHIVLVGSNDTRIWGMSVDERIRRIAGAQNLIVADAPAADGPALLVNRAFVFDPAWLRIVSREPGEAVSLGGKPAIAHCRNASECASAVEAMAHDAPLHSETSLSVHRYEDGAARVNAELRKREQPFLLRLEPASVRAAERASYFGAYKGVTDLLTKYLWPEWALVLTRLAARLGISPNMVTTIGAAFCVIATWLFWRGDYWAGIATGFVFMVLDTVDGKLARCTITSSKWGNVFDHGLDLVHPPFWWYAWGVGLGAYGTPIGDELFGLLMLLIVGGYVVQRVIEGTFMRLYGMHIHVWRQIDSRFRLITARRNPNMVILIVSLLFGRPDLGLVGIAWWTVFSCIFHLVRLIQAMAERSSGRPIQSWLG